MKLSTHQTLRPRWWCAAAIAALVWGTAVAAPAQSDDEPSPFTVQPALADSNGAPVISFTFRVPPNHHIYADRLTFELNGTPLSVALPAARRITDKFSKGEKLAFENDFSVRVPVPAAATESAKLAVTFQGCSESECYFPETHEYLLQPGRSLVSLDPTAASAPAGPGKAALAGDFKVAARASGFIGSEKFLQFLDSSSGTPAASGDLFAGLGHFGLLATLGLILLGGLALNLTPCVLPMIPINLAILGAGAGSQDRRRGFLLGSTYGLGMALAYGALGLVVVLTGSRFGTLNASPWFNFAIAIVFIVLGLAMFDKIAIDLSRFQRTGGGGKPGSFLAAGVMGSISALLAGACVAPVVISVLLLATTFYQRGDWMGLALPFVLGVGMALPWPFAAAGLTFLPKPGAWMTRVKYGFGVVIFAFAAWYGWLGWSLSGVGRGEALLASARSNGVQDLRAALESSRRTGRPVVVDFWASWCKNCEAMEASTFRDATVRNRLTKDYLLVKFQAERLSDPELKPVLDEFGVMGLPTYIVLRPENRTPGPAQSVN